MPENTPQLSLPNPNELTSMARDAAERIRELAVLTPMLQLEPTLPSNNQIVIKDETMQPVRSFKNRGAGNAVSFHQDLGKKRFVAASAGNHARGLARGAKHFGLDSTIVVPECTSEVNQGAIRRLGAELHVNGATFDDSLAYSLSLAEDNDMQLVHPYADPLVVAGQATIGLELLEQQPDMTHLVLPVGGGGLLAGVATIVKNKLPNVKVVAAQVRGCDAYAQSLDAGAPQKLSNVDTRFGGVAVAKTDVFNFELGKRVVDQAIVLDPNDVYKSVFQHKMSTGVLLEPAGAVGRAASMHLAHSDQIENGKIVTVATGANPAAIVGAYTAARARRFGWRATD